MTSKKTIYNKNLVLIFTIIISILLFLGAFLLSNVASQNNNIDNKIEKKLFNQTENGNYYTLSAESGNYIIAKDNYNHFLTIKYKISIDYLIPNSDKLAIYSSSAYISYQLTESFSGVEQVSEWFGIGENFELYEILISAISLKGNMEFISSNNQYGAIVNQKYILYGQNEPYQEFNTDSISMILTSGWGTPTFYETNYWLELGELITAMKTSGILNGDYIGYENGYNEGYDKGYDLGYSQGFSAGNDTEYSHNWLVSLFDAVNNIFQVEIFTGFKLWYLIGAPLLIALIVAVLKFLR